MDLGSKQYKPRSDDQVESQQTSLSTTKYNDFLKNYNKNNHRNMEATYQILEL